MITHEYRASMLVALLAAGTAMTGCRATAGAQSDGGRDVPVHPPEERAVADLPADAVRELYLASIAAAEFGLRLHETERVRRWLSAAPPKHRGWEWRYLHGMTDRSASSWQVADSPITDVAVSPGGEILAVTGGRGTALLLDAETGRILHELAGHTAAVWSPAFSSDGRRVATASSDGTVRVWDVDSGRQLQMLPGNGRGVAGLAWSPGDRRLAVGSWDWTEERGVWGTLNVWDPASGDRVEHIEHGGYPIASISYDRDGSHLVGGTWDWDLVVWDTAGWGEPKVIPPPETPDYKRISDFDFSPDGSVLAVAYADDRVRLWDLSTAQVIRTLHTAAEGVIKGLNDVAYLPDGKRIATAGGDMTLRLWDAATGDQIGVFHGASRPLNTVTPSPDGRRLYTGDSEGRVRTWDLEELDPTRSVWPVPHTVYDVALSPDETRAVVATWEGWLRVIDVATGTELLAWQGHDRAAVAADWSDDGRWIASTGSDGRVVLWDADSGALVRELADVDRQLESLAFSPDGLLLAAPLETDSTVVWRIPSGEVAAVLGKDAARPGRVAWNRQGMLATGYADGTVGLETPGAGAEPLVIPAFDSTAPGVPAIAFDPRAPRMAVGSGRSLRIVSTDTGTLLTEFAARSAAIIPSGLAFSPDGARLAAAVSGNTFELWDAQTGDALLSFPQESSAWAVRWTSGEDLLLVPLDETVRVLRPAPRE